MVRGRMWPTWASRGKVARLADTLSELQRNLPPSLTSNRLTFTQNTSSSTTTSEDDDISSALSWKTDFGNDETGSGRDFDWVGFRLLKWTSWFLSSKGNEYFCEVEEDFIVDRFNLTGLNAEVPQYYSQALDTITDNLEEDDIQEELRTPVDSAARLLYGLIHARWIITARGLAKMLEKYKKADFGRCPRVLCQQQPLLPVGLSDIPYEKSVKLYCGRCEDIYSPKSARHGSIDGAYFGTSFPHMLFLVYPAMIPPKAGPSDMTGMIAGLRPEGEGSKRSRRRGEDPEAMAEGVGDYVSTANAALKAERYRPRIFGFQVHEVAKLQRWQEAVRDRQVAKLEELEEQQGM